jgi:hypothetical protein
MIFVDRWDMRPVPYDVAEDFASFVGADSNKTGAIGTIVIFSESIGFSLRMFHIFTILCGFLTV